MSRTRTRTLTAALAVGRLGFGAALIARPERTASGWLGEDARRAPVQVAVRGVGARDAVIGAGVLATVRDQGAQRLWLAGGIASDLCDVASALATSGGALPPGARRATVALAGGSALAGVCLLATGDR